MSPELNPEEPPCSRGSTWMSEGHYLQRKTNLRDKTLSNEVLSQTAPPSLPIKIS